MEDLKRLLFILALILAGYIMGMSTGIYITNVRHSDTEELKQEIRIKVDEMDLERIQIDELVEKIRSWQMEVDEIWLYYGTSQPLRCQAMMSERPSEKD